MPANTASSVTLKRRCVSEAPITSSSGRIRVIGSAASTLCSPARMAPATGAGSPAERTRIVSGCAGALVCTT